MSKLPNERDFQNYIKDLTKLEGGWYSQLHPGMSSDVGIPDLLLATDAVGILPVEVKIGNIADDNKTLLSRSIRPAQIAWHYRVTSHGYPSAVMIGVWEGGAWRIFVVYGADASKVKDGFEIGKDAIEINPRFFTAELDEWASEYSDTFSNTLHEVE